MAGMPDFRSLPGPPVRLQPATQLSEVTVAERVAMTAIRVGGPVYFCAPEAPFPHLSSSLSNSLFFIFVGGRSRVQPRSRIFLLSRPRPLSVPHYEPCRPRARSLLRTSSSPRLLLRPPTTTTVTPHFLIPGPFCSLCPHNFDSFDRINLAHYRIHSSLFPFSNKLLRLDMFSSSQIVFFFFAFNSAAAFTVKNLIGEAEISHSGPADDEAADREKRAVYYQDFNQFPNMLVSSEPPNDYLKMWITNEHNRFRKLVSGSVSGRSYSTSGPRYRHAYAVLVRRTCRQRPATRKPLRLPPLPRPRQRR
ncbi:hypothetical protein L596_019134 [Steinernema carpocapsae]|uniref:Uncharacterized protein n=1 Tax=Steinernema carpocapsae TaxID=34508 RepID=A0A4U5N7J5_STECR|nr:hypothetical protein L596_019134 [Steinernema carpocapsae]